MVFFRIFSFLPWAPIQQILAGDELWFLVGIQAVKKAVVAMGWWQVDHIPRCARWGWEFSPVVPVAIFHLSIMLGKSSMDPMGLQGLKGWEMSTIYLATYFQYRFNWRWKVAPPLLYSKAQRF